MTSRFQANKFLITYFATTGSCGYPLSLQARRAVADHIKSQTFFGSGFHRGQGVQLTLQLHFSTIAAARHSGGKRCHSVPRSAAAAATVPFHKENTLIAREMYNLLETYPTTMLNFSASADAKNTYMSNGFRMNMNGTLANPTRSAQVAANNAGALTRHEASRMGLPLGGRR